MPLSDLAYLIKPEDADDADNGDHEDPASYSDPVPPEVFPSDLNYVATIFIDAARAWTDDELGAIEKGYTERFPGRRFRFENLHRESLRFWRPFVFPQGERLFLQQGYVSDLESRIFRRGHQPQTLFGQQQWHALYSCSAILWEVLEGAGVELGLVAPAQGRSKGAYRKVLNDQVGLQLGHLLGLHGRDAVPSFLVEHGGLLLSCSRPLVEHRIHVAAYATPLTARDQGRRSELAQALFEREFDPIRKQVRFELGAAGTLFNIAHWPQHQAEQGGALIEVTAGMIATWYSQVLTSVRKLVWEAQARAAPRVLRNDLFREAEVHPQPVGVDTPPRAQDDIASYTELLADEADRIADKCHRPEFPPKAKQVTADQVTARYTDEQWLSAALHGTTFSHDTRDEEPEVMRAAAAWIGDLKRTGKAHLDVFDAERLLLARQHAIGEREVFFRSQFSEALWTALYEAAEAVDASSQGIGVTYAWTRDLTRPWSVERTSDSLRLTGPLLSFPACRAAFWREKADLVRELEEFKIMA